MLKNPFPYLALLMFVLRVFISWLGQTFALIFCLLRKETIRTLKVLDLFGNVLNVAVFY